MEPAKIDEAAKLIWQAWQDHVLLDALPAQCRPHSVEDGYAVQRRVAELSGARTVGWKIAATSEAGQKHIGVDGPLAGRLLSSACHGSGATLPAGTLHMAVAEVEFAFRIGADLDRPSGGYSAQEVVDQVASLHPAIEIPDSRFSDFTVVGAPQLIADNACTEYFVLGEEARETWRDLNLAQHKVRLYSNGSITADGVGANALGDPREALAWIANDRTRRQEPLRSGDIVTTGTCIVPAAIAEGESLVAEFGPLGAVEVRMV